MAKILGVGIATLDIINQVAGFPTEDSEVRATDQTVRTGGNVSNTLSVLTQFDHRCHFAGVLSEDADGKRIQASLNRQGIDLAHATILGHGHAPTSYITLNAQNGSRTIVHYRDLPEYDLGAFMNIPVSEFDWLHFEARHCEDTAAMMAVARHQLVDQPISLEVEKERDYLDQLFPFPDIIFFSRAFARGRGHEDPEAFLTEARNWAPQAVLVLAWGEGGAYLQTGDQRHHAPARPVAEVVDTVGAGDTLIAGFIHARASGRGWLEALYQGVRLAERKIAQHGFDQLGPAGQIPADQILCRLEDLGPQDALGVAPVAGVPSVIVVRQDDSLHAYANVCPHNGSPLCRSRRGFLVARTGKGDKALELRCDVHDARFDIGSGHCTDGPCAGDDLRSIPLRVQGHSVLRANASVTETVATEPETGL